MDGKMNYKFFRFRFVIAFMVFTNPSAQAVFLLLD